MDPTVCATRATAQGLTRATPASPAEVVKNHGWLRTLGGAEAYLALAARRPSTTPDEVHAAILAGELAVVPAVRGCIYVVPRDHVPLALRLARALDRATLVRNLGKAGSSQAEAEQVGEVVLAALDAPKETREITASLPAGVNRSLGDAGKKVGLSSLVPPALRLLEWSGRVGRMPVGGRLDHERYAWVRVDRALEDTPLGTDLAQLVELYYRWAGHGTVAGLISWSGFTKKLLAPHVTTAPTSAPGRPEGRAVALGGLDNLTALHENAAFHVDDAHAGRPAEVFGWGAGTLGAAPQLFERLVTVDGRIVGVWGWDPDQERVEAVRFGPVSGWDEALADAERVLRALGHGRAMVLDNPASLRRRLGLVRGTPGA